MTGSEVAVGALGPIVLPANTLARFYRGGARIAAFRALPADQVAGPEDWIGAVTASYGTVDEGVSRLPDGRLLTEAIAADPVGYLGPERAALAGADTGLLVKLLDAGERLALHTHPDGAFAARHLAAPTGKTEAWIVLDAEPDATLGLGFREAVDAETLARWVAEQDLDAMLAAVDRFPVRSGDVWFVPAGLPHIIGAGLLILEVQQPADMSIMLEWQGFMDPGDPDATLGLPWATALEAVDRSGWDAGRRAALRGTSLADARGGDQLMPPQAAPFFGVEMATAGMTLEPSFAILVGIEGAATLVPEHGAPIEIGRGATVLVPHGAGAVHVDGDARIVRCLPPRSS